MEPSESVRLAVYRHFASTGQAPTVWDLSHATNISRDDIPGHLQTLHEQRHIVMRDGQIVMAHPFSSIPLGFGVMGRDTLWWGGCAWDSFALAHLLPSEEPMLVATRCPGCDTPIALSVSHQAPPQGTEVAHFLVPTTEMWKDVVHTCNHQRIFCGEDCVDKWLRAHGHTRGYVMSMETLWTLAKDWYAGRLEPGYRRREPAEAKGYFKDCGLSGPFWGLP